MRYCHCNPKSLFNLPQDVVIPKKKAKFDNFMDIRKYIESVDIVKYVCVFIIWVCDIFVYTSVHGGVFTLRRFDQAF